jgi:hypothetical protein
MERIMSLRIRILTLLALASFAAFGVTASWAGSVTLFWSAPGDDSLTGRASRYDVRYSTQTITPANFAQASAASNLPVPGLPGATQSARIDLLQSGQTFFFAIKSADTNNNWSIMSNVASGVSQDVVGVGATLTLAFSAPAPNPARERSSFRLELPVPMRVQVEVFDISGRRIRTLLDEARGAGVENLAFDLRDDHGSRLAQGIYLVRARLGDTAIMRRLIITR